MLRLTEEAGNQKAATDRSIGKSLFFSKMKSSNGNLSEKILKDISEYWLLVGKPELKVIDGGEEEAVTQLMLKGGLIAKLNEEKFPNSYLYRSAPFDVARSEKDTYICTRGTADDAGPTNYWLNTDRALEIARSSLKGAMAGKTLYIVPYWLGPLSSPFGQGGIELTDSPYVVLNLMKITRVGSKVAEPMARSNSYVLGMHATADLNPDNRYVMHFSG